LQHAQENKQPTKQNERDQIFDSLRQGDVVAGVVQNVQPYGVFVDIGTPALLHISAITAVRLTTETLGELFKVGLDQIVALCGT
jgi:ribosomal protein S1